MLWIIGFFFGLWAFDGTHICNVFHDFLRDYTWLGYMDQLWNWYFYDWYYFDSYKLRNTFFNAFMNDEMYEIIFKNESDAMDVVKEAFGDTFKQLGINLDQYDLKDEKQTFQLFQDFMKNVNFDFSKINELNKK